MATLSLNRPRLASSVRMILAMFRLYADIETGFGKAVLDILKKQYPDQKVTADPASVGHKLMAIARKQNQYDDQRAMDSVQDLMAYLVGAGAATKKEREVEVDDPKSPTGKRPDTEVFYERGKAWDFATQTAKTWQEALDAIYSNLRKRAMSKSIDNQKRKKREQSVDDAFGKRGEDGGAPDGGQAHMPTPDGGGSNTNTESVGELGKALDDKAAIKEFYDLLDMHIPDLRSSLTPESRALFDVIFEDEEGGFSSDIKANMGQATTLKEKNPDLFEKHADRWSGFVGDLRKKLLTEIWSYVDNEMSDRDYARLKEAFFAETTPDDVSSLRKKEDQKKVDYQRGIDERKMARFKWMEQNGKISDKDKKSADALAKKLKGMGVDVDGIVPAPPEKKKKGDPAEEETQVASVFSIAARVASRHWS